MVLKTYFVKGLNYVDTIQFDTIQEQTTFFNSKMVEEIENVYFPVLYTNEIKIETNKLNNLTNVNYLSISTDEKTFYYFITDAVYLNESLNVFTIMLDSIQTFMFDITFLNANVERFTINRWIGDNINRDYIRENVSQTEFDFTNTLKMGDYVFLVNTTNIETKINYNGNDISLGTGWAVVNNVEDYMLRNEDNSKVDNIVLNVDMPRIVQSPSTLGVYIVNKKFFTGIEFLENGDMRFISGGGYRPIGLADVSSQFPGIDTFKNFNFNELINITDFVKNNYTNTAFSWHNCPQLLDSNYYQLFYGQKNHFSFFPLEKLKTKQVNYNTKFDINQQVYAFQVDDNTNQDAYNTWVYSSEIRQIQLLNDAWKTYLSQNSATMVEGLEQQQRMAIYSMVQGGINAGFSLASPFVTSQLYGAGGATSSFVGGVTNLYEIGKTREIIKGNLMSTPDTIKRNNTGIIDSYTNLIDIFEYKAVKQDIQQAAIFFERNGYRVNYYLQDTNLFTWSKQRLFFNYIQTTSLNIELATFNYKSFVDNVKDRFNNGIRFWYAKGEYKEIGDYQYDNVERNLIT